jgi:glycosyltransferase involved in cell wall biosynthesis
MVEAGPARPIRVGFVMAGLYGGGAERAMLTIVEALDRTRFMPTLIVFDEHVDHLPPRDVPVLAVPRRGATPLHRLGSRMRQIADLVRDHHLDLLVSFLLGPNIVSVVAAKRAGIPVIVGERSAPSEVLSNANLGWARKIFWANLVRLAYPRASYVLTNTEGARDELLASLHIAPDRIAVIPNPIDIDRIVALASEPIDPGVELPPHPILVHVGRFSFAKDHDTLLGAFVRIRQRRPATLVLVGGGEDEARVRALSASLGLGDSVVFTGFTRNPYRYLARATVSVLTSRFEGLPNALIESMAVGAPIVSTACRFGPLEVLGDSEFGVLTPVGDAEAFAAAVDALLDDPERRRVLAERGRVRALDFDRRRLLPVYEALFERAVRRAGESAISASTRGQSLQPHR